MIRVTFINNDLGGYAKKLEIPEDTIIGDFFSKTMKELKAKELDGMVDDDFGPDNDRGEDVDANPCDIDPANYVIRVNRMPVTEDQVLQDGDKVTVTPTKIDGA